MVQAETAQLRGQAGALHIRVSAQMDITAEHAGADQGDFDFSFHWVLKVHACMAPPRITLSGPERNPFLAGGAGRPSGLDHIRNT
jgi:hypothetical protein